MTNFSDMKNLSDITNFSDKKDLLDMINFSDMKLVRHDKLLTHIGSVSCSILSIFLRKNGL